MSPSSVHAAQQPVLLGQRELRDRRATLFEQLGHENGCDSEFWIRPNIQGDQLLAEEVAFPPRPFGGYTPRGGSSHANRIHQVFHAG